MTKINFLFIGIIIAFFHLNVHAQGVKIYKRGGTVITIPYTKLDSIVSQTEEEIDHDLWVDLGLPSGVKWATRNIGASSPEDYGDYFAWGETSPKETYYVWNNLTDGVNPGEISGNPKYDAAAANWGGGARMPTEEECKELILHCTQTDTIINHVRGGLMIGPNGNRIFLPRAGHRSEHAIYQRGDMGEYWCSTPSEDYFQEYANYFYVGSEYMNWWVRFWGRTVRAIHD